MSFSLRALPLLLSSGLLLTGCTSLLRQVSAELRGGAARGKPVVTVTQSGFSHTETAPTAEATAPKQVEFEAGQPIHTWITVSETLRDIPNQNLYVSMFWTANPALTDPQKLQEFVKVQESAYSPNWEDLQDSGDLWRTNIKIPEAQAAQKTFAHAFLLPQMDLKDEARLRLLNKLASSAMTRSRFTVLVRYSWSGANETRYDAYNHFILDTSKGSYDAMALAVGAKVTIPNPKMVDAALEKQILQAANLKWGPSEKKTYFKAILNAEDWSRVTSGSSGELEGRSIDVWVLARSKDKKACYAEPMEAEQQHMSAGVFGQAKVDDRENIFRVDCARFKGM
ncbi:hypothetical protein ATI61_110152 [Archangium gephyra]|uniref:Lipoprotein n=1 Tax=Archangium gephyra TaxID=48 RepID=A0AAC8QEM7_9BACT|nr:hypothetical protein [Archangium gephyra]AKJ06101.1 Hypothetical protein AA314_07727 [Archangium gephyra]REG27145.1 hypothetical protein ATI61_110152 [Archangium gephyra]